MIHLNGHTPLPNGVARAEIKQVRLTADRLLKQLIDDRDRSEQRFLEMCRTDPLKSVTGRSAMDRAVHSTEDIIRYLEEVMMRQDAKPTRPPATAEPVATSVS